MWGWGVTALPRPSLDLFDEMKVLRYGMIAYWGLPSFNPVVLTCCDRAENGHAGAEPAPLERGIFLGRLKRGKKRM